MRPKAELRMKEKIVRVGKADLGKERV